MDTAHNLPNDFIFIYLPFSINIRTHEKSCLSLAFSKKKRKHTNSAKKNYFDAVANATNPIIVMRIPVVPRKLGRPAPRKRTSPARANTTSLHWVASTAASFAGVSALPLAYRNMEAKDLFSG